MLDQNAHFHQEKNIQHMQVVHQEMMQDLQEEMEIVHSNQEKPEEKIENTDLPTVENDSLQEAEAVHTMANQQIHTEANVMAEDSAANQVDHPMHEDQDKDKKAYLMYAFFYSYKTRNLYKTPYAISQSHRTHQIIYHQNSCRSC